MSYVSRYAKNPPRSLTEDEQERLLRVTGQHKSGFRDHMVYSLALGTGLRLFEIAALNIADVYKPNGTPRSIIILHVFKGHQRKNGNSRAPQQVHVPEALRYKLKTFFRYKKKTGEPIDFGDPLFISKRGTRLSSRSINYMFTVWQEHARFDRHYRFHDLRHTCGYNLFKATKDIRVVQRQLRHRDINTSMIYMTPSAQDMSDAVDSITC
jgi:site-specific recombinase XerC